MADKLTPNPPANLTDATYAGFRRELADATRKREEAVAAERHVLKRAKGAGINVAAMKEIVAIRRQDVHEVQAHQKALQTYAAWEGLTDLPLFGGAAAVSVSAGVVADFKEQMAEEAGYQAGKDGGDRTDENPFPAGTPNHVAFDGGWIRGQTFLAAGLSKTPKGATKASTARKKPDVAAKRAATAEVH